MGFQKCPICNGTGIITNNGNYSAPSSTCPVCQGKRIINELTGLPPFIITDTDKKVCTTDNANTIGQQLDLNYRPRLSEDVQERIEYYSNLKK